MGESMDGCITVKSRTLDMIEKSSVAKKEDFTPAQDRLRFVLFLRNLARDTTDLRSFAHLLFTASRTTLPMAKYAKDVVW